MRVAVIAILASEKQNQCFWPTYNKFKSGIEHDLIIVHRNMVGIPECAQSNSGNTIFEDKSNINGQELPHKAFGAYRYFGLKYLNKYDYFAFISDDVLFQDDNWLLDSVKYLNKYDKLGFLGTQIFNGLNAQYPHPSHCRAPIWFSKKDAIKNIKWEFKSDHDGEMRIANSFIEAGFFGAQLGNKIDVAYDALEAGQFGVGDHIASIFSKHIGFEISKKDEINNKLFKKLIDGDDSDFITSPYKHIGKRKIISQIQPFNGLIIDSSLHLAKKHVETFKFNTHILKEVND